MVILPYHRATCVFHDKQMVLLSDDVTMAVVEFRVYRIPADSDYPEGVKYSMYCVNPKSNTILLGIDNHRPKGHHLHCLGQERPYAFTSIESLIDDFWARLREMGIIV